MVNWKSDERIWVESQMEYSIRCLYLLAPQKLNPCVLLDPNFPDIGSSFIENNLAVGNGMISMG